MTMRPVPYQIGTGSGAVKFYGLEVPHSLVKQAPPSWASGFPVDRATRENTFPFVLDSMDGGFVPQSGFFGPAFKNRPYRNQGIMVHIPRLASLAYKSTSVAALDDIDISGFRAANKRVHSIMSSLGVSGQRFLAAIGSKVYIDTSTTNPALTLADDGLTNNVVSIANLKLNNTLYTAVSTDGQTNDTRGATDVTAGTPFSGGTELVTHANSADRFYAMDHFPSLRYNVFFGVINNVNGVWAYPDGAATLPLTSSTLQPVVFEASKDIEDPNGVTYTTAMLSPAFATGEQISNTNVWTNVNNVLASDDNRAKANNADSVDFAGRVTSWGYDTLGAGIHDSDLITGYQFRIEALRGSDTQAAFTKVTPSMNLGGAPLQEQLIGTSDANYDFGSTTNRMGLNKTGADLKSLIVYATHYVAYDGAGSNNYIEYDYATGVTLTYKPLGTQIKFPQGGWQPGKPPHRAARMAYVHPVTDELATTFKPHIVSFIDFSFDAAGNRLVGTTSQPPTQMDYVDDANWYQGGLAVSGGNVGGPGQSVKLIDDADVTRDLGFPAVHGSTPVRVVSMFARGAVLVAYVCDNASTDAQCWMYWNGRWNILGVLFSKAIGGAMSTQPLAWSEKTLGTQQNQGYCFYPSSTNTAYVRQFIPADPMNADPFLVNTTEVKQDGPLYVDTLEIEVLPSEANSAIMALQCQSRRVDDNTAYGSVNVKVNVTGDHTFGASAVNETFDATAECFTDRNLFSSGDPGVACKTVITRFTLDHEAGTAKSPNALPVILFKVAEHKPLEKFDIYLADEQDENPVSLAKRLRALKNSKVAQRFLGAGRDIPVKFDYEFEVKRASMGTMSFGWADMSKKVIRIEQTVGGTSA